MYTLGYDIGTRFIKVCIVKNKEIVSSSCFDIGTDLLLAIKKAKKTALQSAKIQEHQIKSTAVTGYGADILKKKGKVMNNAVALAHAVHHLNGKVRTIVDIGGLFINVININEKGKIIGRKELEKCAAGSGKFLETILYALELSFDTITQAVCASTNPHVISTGCAVFAESEVITHVNNGAQREDIVAGIVKSIVSKVTTSINRSGAEDAIALVGGVSKIVAFQKMLQDVLKRNIAVLPIDVQLAGAYGAGIFAGNPV